MDSGRLRMLISAVAVFALALHVVVESAELRNGDGANRLSDCDRDVPPELGCPVSNGFQKYCSCLPFGGGCWCSCPYEADSSDGQCIAKPTRIGEGCIYSSSCSLIANATCDTSVHVCVCHSATYPTNSLASCIPKPEHVGQSCSSCGAGCELISGGSICDEGSLSCICPTGSKPNTKRTGCVPVPVQVGDQCSDENPCSGIPGSLCQQPNEEEANDEPTCQCPPKYIAAQDGRGTRCLPTLIGLRCEQFGSTCEAIAGATCFGL